MKGLILKDFYMIWKNCKIIIFMLLFFLAGGTFFLSSNVFFVTYPPTMAGMLTYTVIAYEEQCKWRTYCDTLSVSRKEVVISKYLVSLICILIALAGSSISMAVNMLVYSSWNINVYLLKIISAFSMAVISCSVVLPFVFKFSIEKARLVYLGIVGGASAISVIVQFPQNLPELSMTVVALAVVLLMALSLLISCKVYENREL